VKIEDEVDRLYQLPLKEFTPARNALAKQADGDHAATVRALQKPSVPAWAVNQLYWQKRAVYDELVEAAERLRTTHRSLLEGKSVDLHAAEDAHRNTVKSAQQAIRTILAQAGESQSPANITAIAETLEALPSADETPGRLTRPLKRMGFEALAGVPPRAAGASSRTLTLVKTGPKQPTQPEISEAKKREIDDVEKRLNAATFEARQLQAEVERARRDLQRAETSRDRVAQELEEATEKVTQARADLTAREKAQRSASAELTKLEEKLGKLRNQGA
jgi:uncharacterized coiled-coil DUF342 family protein